MRWLKHLTCAHDDEALAELVDECGLEGYGFYWMLMEVIAESMDKSDRCELTYSLPQWSRRLNCHHNKVSKYLGKLQVMGRVTVDTCEGKVRVVVPNLLKYRDEYSKKSGQSQEDVRRKDRDTQADGELDTTPIANSSKNTDQRSKPEPSPAETAIANTAILIHANHPKARCDIGAKGIQTLLAKILRHQHLTGDKAVEYLRALGARHAAWANSPQWKKDGGEYAKGLTNWLAVTAERYEQEPPDTVVSIAAERNYPKPTSADVYANYDHDAARKHQMKMLAMKGIAG